MPEGDTIYRAARTLSAALAGRVITELDASLPGLQAAGLVGVAITTVEARGKNLLIHLADGRVIYTHMRMRGSWHVYRPGERWQKPRRMARLIITTTDFIAVCFNAPVVELLGAGGAARHEVLGALGPDLLNPRFDPAEARRRLRHLDDRPIGEALLVQRAMAGVGNVYKSEVLFVAGINPFVPVSALGDPALDDVIAVARRLLGANLGGHPRDTRGGRPGGRYWIYGRSGKPCFRCGAAVRGRRQGLAGRSTYWCPRCQASPGPGGAQPGR